jgi:hypothetical protein
VRWFNIRIRCDCVVRRLSSRWSLVESEL